MKQKQDENHTQVQNLERLKGKENITQSGQKIDVCANIGTREDIENVLRSDAGGIGLFRSEFLYIENGTKLPTEEQQFQVYRLAAEAMGTKKVVIRTADLGGEKQAECLELEKIEIRRSAIGESVYRWIKMRYLRHSSVQFTCIRIWKYVGHVSDDHGCGRSKTGETDSGKDKE